MMSGNRKGNHGDVTWRERHIDKNRDKIKKRLRNELPRFGGDTALLIMPLDEPGCNWLAIKLLQQGRNNLTEAGAEEHLAESKTNTPPGQEPVIIVPFDVKDVSQVLKLSQSPDRQGVENLIRLRRPGLHFIAVITDSGATYELVDLN
jgi:hypothetical protein